VSHEGPRKGVFYTVKYELPGKKTIVVKNKATCHFPDKWVDPDPPPEAVIHGTITKTIRPKVSLTPSNLPPSIINFAEVNEDDDAVSAINNSQLTDDSAMSTVLLSPPKAATEPIEPFEPVEPIEPIEPIEPVEHMDVEPTTATTPAFDKPVFRNGLDWFPVTENKNEDINGTIPVNEWSFFGHDGEWMYPNDDLESKRPVLDYFLTVMPPDTMRRVLKETNDKLQEKKEPVMFYEELLRFFGVCILIMRCDFEQRRKLWTMQTGSKYVPPTNLGATGMSRHRFYAILACLTFGIQPANRPIAMSSAAYRWLLVDGFVNDYNSHRKRNFRPSELVSPVFTCPGFKLTILTRFV
jgi:hypothetical protein